VDAGLYFSVYNPRDYTELLLIIIFLRHHQRCQEYDTPLLLEIHGSLLLIASPLLLLLLRLAEETNFSPH